MDQLLVLGILAFLGSFLLTTLLTPIAMKIARKYNKVGRDIHKEGQPPVPEMGGTAMLVTLVVMSVLLFFVVPSDIQVKLLVFASGTLIAGVIGIIDDLRPLSAIMKPGLLLFAALPIMLTGTFDPHPVLPIVGQLRLTILYYGLLPLVISVPANSINMIDVYNGSMASTSIVALLGVALGSYLYFGATAAFYFSFLLVALIIGVLLGFLLYNRYPARVFSGDTGSLTIGAAIGLLSVLASIEFIVLVAIIPMVMNSFSILSSVKGLKERREMPARAVLITEDYKLQGNPDPRAPVTLAKLVLTGEPLHEYEAVRGFIILTFISALFAVISGYLMSLVV